MAEGSESNEKQFTEREWKIKPPPMSLVWGWHAAGTEHVHPGKVSMLSLRRVPVCVLCASLHYSWHLWFHALHTPHGRSFSSSDSSSLLSPPFITHLLCSITILITLTSAHIRTAISLCWLTKHWGAHTHNVTDWHTLTCIHAPQHKQHQKRWTMQHFTTRSCI